jgi:hypothetical protein
MYFTGIGIILDVQATVAHRLPRSYDRQTTFLDTDDVSMYVHMYHTR